MPDEWVAMTVPGQYQTRYYTVRSLEGQSLTLDVVIHDEGLVTSWAQTDCVGDVVGLGDPEGVLPRSRRTPSGWCSRAISPRCPPWRGSVRQSGVSTGSTSVS